MLEYVVWASCLISYERIFFYFEMSCLSYLCVKLRKRLNSRRGDFQCCSQRHRLQEMEQFVYDLFVIFFVQSNKKEEMFWGTHISVFLKRSSSLVCNLSCSIRWNQQSMKSSDIGDGVPCVCHNAGVGKELRSQYLWM